MAEISALSSCPDADFKFFLDAPPEERAGRRYRELVQQDVDISYEEVYRDLLRRDEIDENRHTSPLKPAPDAIVVDTGGHSAEGVAALIVSYVRGAHGSTQNSSDR